MTREDDGPTLRVELRPHARAHLVSLPAKQLRVYRPHEGVHAIEAFWRRAGRQPFEIAVRTRDVSVRAGCDVDDDFSTLRHEYRSPLARGAGSELIAYMANVKVDWPRRLASRSKANHKLMKRLPALHVQRRVSSPACRRNRRYSRRDLQCRNASCPKPSPQAA